MKPKIFTSILLPGTFTLLYNQGATKVELPNTTLDKVLQEITNIYNEDNFEPNAITLPGGSTINYYPVLAGYYWKSRITTEDFLKYSQAETANTRKEVCHG